MVMRRHEEAVVTGRDGLRGVVETAAAPDPHGSAQVGLRLDDGRRVIVPRDALVAQPDGTFFLPLSPQEIAAALGEADRRQVQSAQGRSVAIAVGESVVIPVVEEHARVETRTVESGRVVVRVVPREQEEVVSVPLAEERVEVERVPVNRVVQEAAPVREEGDVTIIPVYEEVLVVEKRLVLKEEVRLTRHRTTRNQEQRVTVRKEEVTVLRPDGSPAQGSEPARTTNR